MSNLLFEACVDTFADAKRAFEHGAHRLELCADLAQDGLTPDASLLSRCLAEIALPMMVMIRPRGGDFVYSSDEMVEMQKTIFAYQKLGVAGFVFGALTPKKEVDFAATKQLVKAAQPFPVTFHKAIDATKDVFAAFMALNEMDGISRVLTSGGAQTAFLGKTQLRQMQTMPNRRLTLIAAGKITVENRQAISELTGICELHGKAIVG